MFLFYLFLLVAIVFNGLGMIGLLRFPDVYTRLHAATKCTTFGSIFLALAVIGYGLINWVRSDFADTTALTFMVHTFLALAALLLTNPTGAHALARASHRAGVEPVMAVVDRLKEVKK
ncbi:MAG: monovalent cation/H(+) antiporter subunit G [Thermoplasmata archaeon]|nr:monovalent cation/H(+) antiporter subunit G [Thermoplasmata archaeon]